MMAAALVICFLVGLAMGIALVVSGIIPREDETVTLETINYAGKHRGHDSDCKCFLCNRLAESRQEPPNKNRLPVVGVLPEPGCTKGCLSPDKFPLCTRCTKVYRKMIDEGETEQGWGNPYAQVNDCPAGGTHQMCQGKCAKCGTEHEYRPRHWDY